MENETLNELFDKGISEDKLFVITYIAEYLTTMYDFTLYNGRLYAKFDKKYISNEKDIIQRLNDDVKLTKRQFKELLYQLELCAEKITDQVNKIRLNNGILTLTENGIYEVVEDDGCFCPYNLNVNYNKDVKDDIVIKFLNDVSCNNEDIENTLPPRDDSPWCDG